MSFGRRLNAVLALAAAYAVAVQVVLVAVAGPLATGVAFAGQPLCSHFGAGGSTPPAGHAGVCIGVCFGCCCGPSICPTPTPEMTYAPVPAQAIALARVVAPHVVVRILDAHRCRAPPTA